MPEDPDQSGRDQPDDTGGAERAEPPSTGEHEPQQGQAPPATGGAGRPIEGEPAAPSAGVGGESPKRVIHRRTSRYSTSKTTETDETIKETITEDITPPAYQGPVTGPPPVG